MVLSLHRDGLFRLRREDCDRIAIGAFVVIFRVASFAMKRGDVALVVRVRKLIHALFFAVKTFD